MSIPPAFRGIVDDAALFPPGSAPLGTAVVDHATHLTSAHAELVGPFIVASKDLYALAALVPADLYPTGMAVSVVVPDPGGIGSVVERTANGPLNLVAIEVKLSSGQPAIAQVEQISQAAPPSVIAYVEAPRPSDGSWRDVLTTAAATGLRLKFRTGGTEASAFPGEGEVAAWIRDAVAGGMSFKCTAGLHNAVRHTDPETGFEHHGYLNVLLATVAAGEGASASGVAQALALRDPAALADRVRGASGVSLDQARRHFVSYGSCSISEPLHDLAHLGLLDTPQNGRR